MKAWAIIAAGGSGRRMGTGLNKLFLPLGDRPLLAHTLGAFEAAASVTRVLLVARRDDLSSCRRLVERYGFTKVLDVIPGGGERQDSVAAGLAAIDDADGIVAVHDGARPFVSPALIDASVAVAARNGAAVAALPVKDTIKITDGAGMIIETPERRIIYAAQTPQTFRVALLREALNRARRDGVSGTDEASLVERLGRSVQVVPGEERNIKVTTPADLEVADYLQRRRGVDPVGTVRIGFGFDTHPLVEGRALVLGGVLIPHALGLGGHSDADVLVHAVIDALMGAAAMGDIGRKFPDTDQRYRGADSMVLLDEVVADLRAAGWRVGNLDVTVVAEGPRLAPHVGDMEERLTAVLGVGGRRVNVKATTTEGLGFTGRREGIAAYAVATLVPLSEEVGS